MTALGSSARFDGRVDNYLKYRPRYPQSIIPFLQSEIGSPRTGWLPISAPAPDFWQSVLSNLAAM